MKQRQKFPWIWFFVLVIVAVTLLSPLFRPGFFITDDGEWMVIRLSAFYQSLAEGQFPVRLLGRLNNSFGYPVANFLYPGFLYLGSLIHLLGPSFVDTVKMIFGGAIVLAGIFLYGYLRHWFAPGASIVGIMGFLGSPYLLYDLYRRGSVGEVLAFAPAYIALYGIVSQSYRLLPLAVAFLIVSHNSLALILGAAMITVILGRKDKWPLFRVSAIGVGLSAFFWIPALMERSITIFDATLVANSSDYFIGANNVFLLGIPTLMAVGYVLWIRTHKDISTRMISIIILVGYFLSLPISSPLWQLPFLAKLVQFPYRFLSLTVLFGPWCLAYAYTHLQNTRRVAFFCLAGCFYVYGAWSVISAITYVDRPAGYYTTNEGTTTVHDEYLPQWVTQKPITRAINVFEFISGDAEAHVNRVDTQTIDIFISAAAPSVLQINKLYYPGWGVAIDGELVQIDYTNPNGVMRVEIPGGDHHLVANFRETIPRFIADMISIAFGFVYFNSLRKKKRA